MTYRGNGLFDRTWILGPVYGGERARSGRGQRPPVLIFVDSVTSAVHPDYPQSAHPAT